MSYCDGCAERDRMIQHRNAKIERLERVKNEWRDIARAGMDLAQTLEAAIRDTEWGDDFEAEVKAALADYHAKRHGLASAEDFA